MAQFGGDADAAEANSWEEMRGGLPRKLLEIITALSHEILQELKTPDIDSDGRILPCRQSAQFETMELDARSPIFIDKLRVDPNTSLPSVNSEPILVKSLNAKGPTAIQQVGRSYDHGVINVCNPLCSIWGHSAHVWQRKTPGPWSHVEDAGPHCKNGKRCFTRLTQRPKRAHPLRWLPN